MELPPLGARFDQKLRFGAYVIGRARLHKQEDLVSKVDKANKRLIKTYHAVDELTGAVQEAMAQRDFWVEAYEAKVREFYDTVSGSKTLFATTKSIFQGKHLHYIEAPLDEIEARGKQLLQRAEKFIPAKEADYKDKMVKLISKRIAGVVKSQAAVEAARAALKEARDKRVKAQKRWQQDLQDGYQLALDALSKDIADKIYPDLRRIQDVDDDRAGALGEAEGGMNLQMLALKQR